MRACKLLRPLQRRIVPKKEICANSELPVARNKGCTVARCIWKGSYGEGETKNVNLELAQKAHPPGWARKLLCLLQRRVVPSKEYSAYQHHLSFNADKTQLSKFYKSPNPVSGSPHFIFLGQTLSLSNLISHLGHILTYNLSDDDDICAISKDMSRKANCLLHTFSCCDPFVKTRLFSSFCLSLYGDSPWRSSSPQLRALDDMICYDIDF